MFPLKVFQKHLMSFGNDIKEVYSTLEFGEARQVLVQNSKKLEHRSKLCIFVGYPKESRGGLFYDPQDNKVFVSTNATFLEEDHIKNH